MPACPSHSVQNPILTFAPHDLVGAVARMRPFMGQLGTTPAIAMPDSHNAGDFGSFLVGAPHEYGLTAEQLEMRTDGHMDCDAVRAGAILICPVEVPGGGVYMGDMHAFQGDGEIAGHTADVAGTLTLQVHVLKGLTIEGPILFPLEEDLPFLARPLTAQERERAEKVAGAWGLPELEETAPISVIGTGGQPQRCDGEWPGKGSRPPGHDRSRGDEPRHDHRRHRDWTSPGCGPGHLPRPPGPDRTHWGCCPLSRTNTA